jgi:hypothetical protein
LWGNEKVIVYGQLSKEIKNNKKNELRQMNAMNTMRKGGINTQTHNRSEWRINNRNQICIIS